ncbi:MAG: peptidylprolyl isomerase [Rhodospirillales bacterium]|nr:peptidylprolyl isomerase [Rhodospirillales bacterium]
MTALLATATIACAPIVHAQEDESLDNNYVVARVNGIEITRDDVAAYIIQLPAEYQQGPIEELFGPVLERLINQELIVSAARADGVDRDEFYQTELAVLEGDLLSEYYMQQKVEAALTDEAIQAAYDQMIAEWGSSGMSDEVRARHILVGTEAEAQEISDRAKAGEEFAELAKELSIGPSGAEGGDLGWFRQGDMVPEFEAAAYALQAGEVSGPVQSPFGWHVIKMEERRVLPMPTREEITEMLARDAVIDELERLNADADVEIVIPDLLTE